MTPPPAHVVRLRYDEALLRAAVLRFWWDGVGWRLVAAGIVVAACLVFLLGRGDRSWFVGVLATVLGLAVAFVVALYAVHYREALRKFRAMGAPEATLTATDASFTLASGAGTSTLAWSTVAEIRRYPQFWLLLFSAAQFVTLPLADFPPAARAFVEQRVAAAGGRIR